MSNYILWAPSTKNQSTKHKLRYNARGRAVWFFVLLPGSHFSRTDDLECRGIRHQLRREVLFCHYFAFVYYFHGLWREIEELGDSHKKAFELGVLVQLHLINLTIVAHLHHRGRRVGFFDRGISANEPHGLSAKRALSPRFQVACYALSTKRMVAVRFVRRVGL